jgi:hypothetical protein
MASVSRTLLVGGVLIVAGTLLAGFGFYEQRSNTCDPGQKTVITQLQPTETVDTRERPFENLSAEHQTAFREQLPVDGTEDLEERTLGDGNLNTVIVYEGQRFHIYPVTIDNCPPIGRADRVRGGLITAVGAGIVLAVLGRRRLR